VKHNRQSLSLRDNLLEKREAKAVLNWEMALEKPAKDITIMTQKVVYAIRSSAFSVGFQYFLELLVQIHGRISNMAAG